MLIMCIAHGACVMLTSNLWVDVGLVNGAVGIIKAICYKDGTAPLSLPVAVNLTVILGPLSMMAQFPSHLSATHGFPLVSLAHACNSL